MSGIAYAFAIVLSLTLGVGLGGVVVVCAIARMRGFKDDAGARFSLWFALLIVLAVGTPAITAGTLLYSRTEPVIVAPSQPVSVNVTRLMREELTRRSPRRDTGAAEVYEPPGPVHQTLPFAAIVAAAWLCGLTIFILRIAVGLIGLRSIVRRGHVIGRRSTTRGQVLILSHARLSVPVAVGYRRPVVLVPQTLLANEPDDAVEHIMLHELEHLRRYDDVTSLVQSLCMAIVWFNPFAYIVQQWIGIEREMACDEAVVRRIGARHGYASTLWNIALKMADARVPRFTPGFAEGSHTVRRVTNVLECSHARIPRASFLMVAALLLAVFAGASIAGAWAAATARPVINDAARVALLDGTALVVGGRNADGTAVGYARVYASDGRTIARVPLARPRWSATMTRLRSGDVLISGGMTPNGTTADVELYHWRSRWFEAVGRLHIARVAHTATLLPDGTVLIAAGERAPGKLESSTEVYDPATRRFSLTADGYGRISQTAIRVDRGDVLMMGGDPGPGRKRCAIIYSVSRHIYRQAGTLVRATATRLTFELPGGRLVTHTID